MSSTGSPTPRITPATSEWIGLMLTTTSGESAPAGDASVPAARIATRYRLEAIISLLDRVGAMLYYFIHGARHSIDSSHGPVGRSALIQPSTRDQPG
jgi:hypothetical protein